MKNGKFRPEITPHGKWLVGSKGHVRTPPRPTDRLGGRSQQFCWAYVVGLGPSIGFIEQHPKPGERHLG